MVQNALQDWDLHELDFLFIENVGNLVCTASYDLGEDLRVVLLSVTEGEDKPLKYPVLFRKADLVLITKPLAERLRYTLIDRFARKGTLPSDHAPLLIDIEDV